MTDDDLLSRLAADDRAALAEIAARHIHTVYAAALRQTRSATLADDVTQAVFLTLCRKATSLKKGTILVGWLYTTTRNIAATARRAAARRNRHERAAIEQRPEAMTGDNLAGEHGEMLPLLDDAIHLLPTGDRDALLLRYFSNMPFAAVGERLGTTEEGARKRVTRAVEKIRSTFARRGLATTSTAVTSLLIAESASTAPAAIAAGVAAGGSQAAIAMAAPAAALTVKAAAVFVLAAAMVGGATTVAVVLAHAAPATQSAAVASQPQPALSPAEKSLADYVANHTPAAPDPAWFQPFQAVYALAPGEVLKLVPPPFIAERMSYYRWANEEQAKMIPAGPTYLELDKDLAGRTQIRMGFGGAGGGTTVQEIMMDYARLAPHEIAGPAVTLVARTFQGDWVGDHAAPLEAKLDALAAIISRETGKRWAIVPETVERDAAVLVGGNSQG